MTAYQHTLSSLRESPSRWLVTGAAGFIGSHLVEKLLREGQSVTGFDNFATGRQVNLDQVFADVGPEASARFRLVQGDLRSEADCRAAVEGVEHILHQAGLGSVPRSIERPLDSHAANVTGTLNLFEAARGAGVKRVVYASSSSVFGDEPQLPKIESRIGEPLSPYAATKRMLEIYASVWHRCYGMQFAGLRYFNVFGPRQDPNGPYAAVLPKWVAALRQRETVYVNGDGETSRDFCYVANVVQANILAATTAHEDLTAQAFNIALGGRTTLNDLFRSIRDTLAAKDPSLAEAQPVYRDFRSGDVRHSQADISKAQRILGYEPTHDVRAGLQETLEWYWADLEETAA
ncbi:MAG: SDR family oxidoreductase [Roseimicrobium sp.]